MAGHVVHHLGVFLETCFWIRDVAVRAAPWARIQLGVLLGLKLPAFEVVEGATVIDAHWHNLQSNVGDPILDIALLTN